jgi:hypothetical protein
VHITWDTVVNLLPDVSLSKGNKAQDAFITLLYKQRISHIISKIYVRYALCNHIATQPLACIPFKAPQTYKHAETDKLRARVQGGIGSAGFGDGIFAQAAADPVNGRSLIADDESEEGRYRLSDEAAVRESKYQHEFHRHGDTVPLAWLDHSRDPQPSPSRDAGSYKLGRLGVKLY